MLNTLLLSTVGALPLPQDYPILDLTNPQPPSKGASLFGSDIAGLRDAAGKTVMAISARSTQAPGSGRVFLFDPLTGSFDQALSPASFQTYAYFGRSLACVPNTGGQGLDGLAVGANEYNVSFIDEGQVWLYRRSAGTGEMELQVLLNSANPQSGGQFGWAVAGLSDVDGDGEGDVLVGAPLEDAPGMDRGRAYLFSGATGVRIATLKSLTPFNGGRFGDSVSGVPDLNGDGIEDLAVSGTLENSSPFSGSTGRVHLYSGADGRPLRTLLPPPGSSRFALDVEGLEDWDGDGFGEVAVGGRFDAGTRGVIHVFSGATGALLETVESPVIEINGGFGTAISRVPDSTGDGVDEILAGASKEAGIGADTGRAYVIDGASLTLLSAINSPNPAPSGAFGTSVAGLPDVDGDGLGDYAVGAPAETHVSIHAGAAYVFYCEIDETSEQLVRAGSPPNALALPATPTGPVVGQVWSPAIDHSSFAPASALDLLLVAGDSANVPTPDGTLLVSLASSLLVLEGAPGASFSLSVPADCSLVGAEYAVQGLSLEPGGLSATNALDVSIGTQ